MKKIEIKKGINLWLIQDEKFKGYRAGVFFHTPLKKETVTKNALLPLLLKRGSTNYPSKREISDKLDFCMGASLEAMASKRGADQMISFLLSGISDEYSDEAGCFSGAVETLFDVVLNPIRPVNEEYLDGAKKQLAEIIENEKNDKRAYASRRCIEEMAKGHPTAVPASGYAEEIDAVSPEEIMLRYDEVVKTAPVDILIAGAFDEETIVKAVKKAFSPLKEREDVRPTASALPCKSLDTVTEVMSVTQGKLCIGFTLPAYAPEDDRYAAMLVYNSVFGGTASSKLFMNVREKLSLAYYASSSYDRASGLILVSSGIECENFIKARDEIMAQFDLMTQGEITDTEIEVAKKSLINSYMSMPDSVGGLIAFNLGQIISGGLYSASEMAARIEKVTKDGVSSVGKSVKGSLIYFLKGDNK